MILAASLFGLLTLGAVAVVVMPPYKRRLVQSTGISAAAEVVFDLVSDVERVPGWYGDPGWLLSFLRVSKLARWSEHVPRSIRLDAASGKRSDLQIRDVRGREFAYCFTHPGAMMYETIFRIFPRQNGCQLTWEVRYQLNRGADKIAHRLKGEREVWEVMHDSLQSIRCLSESIAARPAWQRSQAAGTSDTLWSQETVQPG